MSHEVEALRLIASHFDTLKGVTGFLDQFGGTPRRLCPLALIDVPLPGGESRMTGRVHAQKDYQIRLRAT